MFPVGFLPLPAELERRDGQVREGERCLGCFGLGLAAEDLAANTLELLADVQFGGVEVGEFPGEPQEFSLAQAQDQD